MTGASNERRAFGQSVGSVPVGVFLRRNQNTHGSRVGRIRTHPECACRVCFVFLTIDRLGARVRVGGSAAVDVSKAVSTNETSRHTSRMRKETVNGETGVECIHARAPKCAVPVVCVSFYLGWGGFGIQVTGNLHGVIGAWLAAASSQRSSTKH